MTLRTNQPEAIPLAPPAANPGRELAVPLIPQQQANWCWAACGDMVLAFHGKPGIRQCDLANWAFGTGACCDQPSGSVCNRPLQDPRIRQLFPAHGLALPSYGVGTVSPQALQLEVADSRPVQVGFDWNGGGGHVALVRGWQQVAGGMVLLVRDPRRGSGRVTYSELQAAYGYGWWGATWTNLRRP